MLGRWVPVLAADQRRVECGPDHADEPHRSAVLEPGSRSRCPGWKACGATLKARKPNIRGYPEFRLGYDVVVTACSPPGAGGKEATSWAWR